MIEWIPYNGFINIEYTASGGFSDVYRANWVQGQILSWNGDYVRNKNMFVALKELKRSSNISDEFLREVNNNNNNNNELVFMIIKFIINFCCIFS